MNFLAWIRLQPCVICGGFTYWNAVKGEGLCDASHVKTKGSGGKIEANVTPMCRSDHRWFEKLSKESKRKLLPIAEGYLRRYKNGGKFTLEIVGREFFD